MVSNIKNNFNINATSDLQSLKLLLIEIIKKTINENNWSQKHAAGILGIDQPKISQIKNNKHQGFSLERLLKFIIALGCDVGVNINIKKENVT